MTDQSTKQSIRHLWFVAGGVIVIGVIVLIIVSKLINTTQKPQIQVVEAPTPTQTPVRMLSAIATQSAFVALEQTHASLSAALAGVNLDDPSLSPPVLDLPLGFGQ